MIQRSILPALINHLEKPEITLITGPRQCGKTTLMHAMMQHLSGQGIDNRSVYLNLDIEHDFRRVQTQQQLLDYLRLQLGTSTKGYVFIDEIQRKEDGGVFLKGIYDSNLPYKFIVSGSGSVELKEKVSEGLAGRKQSFRVNTLSFAEFVNHRTQYQYADKLLAYFVQESGHTSLLEEYLHFGGYPKVVLAETQQEKQSAIQSIYESFVDKDLKELLDVRNTFAIADMLALLSVRIGRLTQNTDLGQKVSLNIETIKKYLYYLEKTYILYVTRPYYRNPESELVKSVMYYFSDLGMRNYVFNRMQHYDPLISGSMLFQNFVYRLLRERYLNSDILYWRTKDDAEVDFVVRSGTDLLPVEVKYADLDTITIPRSLHNFIERYEPKEALVVNRSYTGEREIGGTKVRFVPYWVLV
ncbi:MAG: ATP-binding protein [Patescibacteria group bacterium]